MNVFSCCYTTMLQLQANPLCIVNCLNYGHPKDSLSSLVQTTQKLAEVCKQFNVPVVGGNVSLYNCTDNVSIRSTPIIMMLGLL